MEQPDRTSDEITRTEKKFIVFIDDHHVFFGRVKFCKCALFHK
jgi:hypothetical protein